MQKEEHLGEEHEAENRVHSKPLMKFIEPQRSGDLLLAEGEATPSQSSDFTATGTLSLKKAAPLSIINSG